MSFLLFNFKQFIDFTSSSYFRLVMFYFFTEKYFANLLDITLLTYLLDFLPLVWRCKGLQFEAAYDKYRDSLNDWNSLYQISWGFNGFQPRSSFWLFFTFPESLAIGLSSISFYIYMMGHVNVSIFSKSNFFCGN